MTLDAQLLNQGGPQLQQPFGHPPVEHPLDADEDRLRFNGVGADQPAVDSAQAAVSRIRFRFACEAAT